MPDPAAKAIANRFSSRFLRGYVASKVSSDPVYRAVAARLEGHPHPLLDIGCGVGLLAFYLRERGLTMPIRGVDHDEGKIRAAQDIARDYPDVTFDVADARVPLPRGYSVMLLDLLHYFSDDEQRAMLERVAEVVPPGGMVIIRDAVRDDSWRYRVTYAQETMSRIIAWLKAERLRFPTRESIVEPMRRAGFTEEVIPMWGNTPFNNYLFVFRRSSDGITNR